MSDVVMIPLEIPQNYKVKNQIMLDFPKHLGDLPKHLGDFPKCQSEKMYCLQVVFSLTF